MNTKARRKLSEFSFETEGAHISLVGPSMGGAANGYSTLILKSITPPGKTNPVDGEGNKMEMIEKSAADVMVQKAVDAATKELKDEVAVLKAAATAQVEKARKEKLTAVIGTDTLENTFMAIKSLDDSAFEIVLKGFESAKVDESKSKMFTEAGATGDTAAKKVTKSAEEDTATRLAAKIAAQYKAA